VAEGAGLENRYTGNGIVGSNPTLSVLPPDMSPPDPTPISPASLADAVAGSLLGLALGDALGFVVEGRPRAAAQAWAAEIVLGAGGAERHAADYRFGQYSDDTQLARELLASLVDGDGCWRPEHFAARVGRLFQRGADVGAGPGTRAAALRIAAGEPWTVAATPPPYAGNGSAMRVGPLGALFAGRVGGLRRVAEEQSRVTHGDSRCAAGAVAIAGAAALASSSRRLDHRALLETLADWTEPLDPGTARALTALAEWHGLEPEPAAARIHGLGLAAATRPPAEGFTPFITTTVLWSLYAFLRSPDDYLTAVATAITGGGDTDTTAAMTGAIAGARLGPSALPPALVARLQDRAEWRAAELEALARRSAELVAARLDGAGGGGM
jgi:ADP-ribosylglycohydrolase